MVEVEMKERKSHDQHLTSLFISFDSEFKLTLVFAKDFGVRTCRDGEDGEQESSC